MAQKTTHRRKKAAPRGVRRPSPELADLIGPQSRPLEALVEEVLGLDLMQLPDAVMASPLGERLSALHYPFEPEDRAAVVALVRDCSEPVAHAVATAAPPAKAWLRGDAEEVEVLCPGVTQLMMEAAEFAGAKEPGPFIRGLKQQTLGEFCAAGDELLRAMDFVSTEREKVIDVTIRLRLALRIVRAPRTRAQLDDLANDYRRRGAELARRFRNEEL